MYYTTYFSKCSSIKEKINTENGNSYTGNSKHTDNNEWVKEEIII